MSIISLFIRKIIQRKQIRILIIIQIIKKKINNRNNNRIMFLKYRINREKSAQKT